MAAYLDAWEHERGHRPPDRALERRLRRPRQLHAQRSSTRGTGAAARATSPRRRRTACSRRRAPRARRPAREALYRTVRSARCSKPAALVPLFHDVDYRMASPRVRGLRLRGSRAVRQLRGPRRRARPAAPEAEAGARPAASLHVPMAGVVTSLDPALAEHGRAVRGRSPRVFETLTRRRGRRPHRAVARGRGSPRGGRARDTDSISATACASTTAAGSPPATSATRLERLLPERRRDSRWLFRSDPGRPGAARRREPPTSRASASTRRASSRSSSRSRSHSSPRCCSYASAGDRARGQRAAGRARGTWDRHGPVPGGLLRAGPAPRARAQPQLLARGLPARARGWSSASACRPRTSLAGFRAGRYSLASDLFPADVEALRHEPALRGRLPREPAPPHVLRRLQHPHGGPSRTARCGAGSCAAVDVPRAGAPAPRPAGDTGGRPDPAGAARATTRRPRRGASPPRRRAAASDVARDSS